mmetsp:Transcript_26464/g.52131  ORF Transcript_26464/g.52131 Transcript_26464/m.52131 type:complete len:264 (+) Transcript_26464:502-1293(+)
MFISCKRIVYSFLAAVSFSILSCFSLASCMAREARRASFRLSRSIFLARRSDLILCSSSTTSSASILRCSSSSNCSSILCCFSINSLTFSSRLTSCSLNRTATLSYCSRFFLHKASCCALLASNTPAVLWAFSLLVTSHFSYTSLLCWASCSAFLFILSCISSEAKRLSSLNLANSSSRFCLLVSQRMFSSSCLASRATRLASSSTAFSRFFLSASTASSTLRFRTFSSCSCARSHFFWLCAASALIMLLRIVAIRASSACFA